MKELFAELRRRKFFRVGVAYPLRNQTLAAVTRRSTAQAGSGLNVT
jgi:hypothetical protein